MKTMTDTGNSIRSLRALTGLTLQDVAEEAHISVTYLSRVETGYTTPSFAWVRRVLIVIANNLGERD